MTDTPCRWVASDQPRIVPGRHGYGCNDEACAGCQPCLAAHCRICNKTHADGACPDCLADVRADLAEIGRMCAALPEEVEHRGVEGEAMVLLGPVADPEARGHRRASAAVGRAWVDEADHERHPLTVLGGWQMVVEDARESLETAPVAIGSALAYIDRHLTWIGACEFLPVDELARDLRACRSHVERVLHDGEQIDEGVPCLTCSRPLTRVWGQGQVDDGWECRRCRQQSTEAQYRFAVKADYIANAEWLTDVDMVVRFAEHKIAVATVRSWAADKPGRPASVRKRRHTERTEYNVEDVAATLARRSAA